MQLRYLRVDVIPRKQVRDARGALRYVPDYDAVERRVRAGISNDRNARAEVRGDVEIEMYKVRLPIRFRDNMGPGARIVWDGSEWDVADPPAIRDTRTHSVRHVTATIRRRPRSGKAVPGESR